MIQLECKDLDLGYDNKVVVSKLSFTVASGDYLCIVGENGAGKSTLMKTMLGLKQPLGGHISTEAGLIATQIGYMPQQTVVQKDFPATVREIVRSGCLSRCGMRPFYNKEDKQLAEESMQKLGISNLAKRCYRELSGGQQQRVLLARALCATRKILLLDEPAAGLDPTATQDMYTQIMQLNAGGITVIMVSHDIIAAAKYASHVLHIGGGRALFYGTKDEYINSKIGYAFDLGGGNV